MRSRNFRLKRFNYFLLLCHISAYVVNIEKMLVKNSVFMVTGGASDNFGRATVEELLKEGANVVICDLPTRTLNIYGDDKAIFLPININSEQDVITLIAVIKEKFGRLDGLINCIDFYKSVTLYESKQKEPHSLEDFIEIVNENLIGLFNLIRFSIPLMAKNTPKLKSGRGIIINMSNISAFEGNQETVAYSASKAAIIGMTDALACELDGLRIRCVSVATNSISDVSTSSPFHQPNGIPKIVEEPKKFAHLVKTIIESPIINATTIRLDSV